VIFFAGVFICFRVRHQRQKDLQKDLYNKMQIETKENAQQKNLTAPRPRRSSFQMAVAAEATDTSEAQMWTETLLRYTPVRLQRPVLFGDKGYTLLCGQAKTVRLLVAVTMYNENPDELHATLKGVMENVASLKANPAYHHMEFTAADIAVCIVQDGRAKADEGTKKYATKLGIFNEELITHAENDDEVDDPKARNAGGTSEMALQSPALTPREHMINRVVKTDSNATKTPVTMHLFETLAVIRDEVLQACKVEAKAEEGRGLSFGPGRADDASRTIMVDDDDTNTYMVGGEDSTAEDPLLDELDENGVKGEWSSGVNQRVSGRLRSDQVSSKNRVLVCVFSQWSIPHCR
jgi:hypothetical protein